MKKDRKYDYIRVCAMLAIFVCHVFQVLNVISGAMWLNIGVQMFFVLSAKLISGKKIETSLSVANFYKAKLLRIFIPLWIYLICILVVLTAIGRWPGVGAATMYLVGLAGVSKKGVLGLGHFWYITVLIICYCLVPLMYKIAQCCEKKNKVWAFLLQLIIPSSAILAFLFTKYKYYGVNIALFSGAYFWFYKTKNDKNWSKGKIKYLIPMSLLLVSVKLYLDTTDIVDNIYYDGLFSTAVKGIIGLTLFFVLYGIFPSEKKSRLIDFTSDISYEVYITHQFIILALYEFIPIFKNGFVGGVLLCVCSVFATAVNAIILYYMKTFVEKRIFKR